MEFLGGLVPVPMKVDTLKCRRDGEFLLLPTHDAKQVFALNRTGREVLECCDGTATIDQIDKIIRGKYRVSQKDDVFNDILESLWLLEREGFVKLTVSA